MLVKANPQTIITASANFLMSFPFFRPEQIRVPQLAQLVNLSFAKTVPVKKMRETEPISEESRD